MSHFLAIILRSILLLALVANGSLSSVHAHNMAAPATAESVASNAMPCHDEASGESLAPSAELARTADQHACCDADCVCDFVVSTAITAIAWMPGAVPVESIAPVFSIGEVLSSYSPRLLRPPIA